MNNLKSNLPNIVTFLNMSLGIIAILMSVSKDDNIDMLVPASLLIMVAALTDRLDGKIARLFDVTSELGKQLDSLSDLISFGLAPAIIAWKINFIHMGLPGYLIILLFPLAGAYRLARFNITTFDNYFRGIPITISGAFLTIDNIYNCFAKLNGKYSRTDAVITIIIMLLLSYLMVSSFKMKKI